MSELLYTDKDLAPDDPEDDFDPFEEDDPNDPSYELEERILDEEDDFGTKVPGRARRRKRG